MNDLLVLIGIVILIIAVAFAAIYAFLRVTSYYKQRFGVSMGPAIISICLAVDLFLVSMMIYANNTQEQMVLWFIIAAVTLFAYGMIRNVKSYGNMSVGAIGIQLLVALLQVFIVSFALVTIIIRKCVKRQSGQMRMLLDWTKYIWNI